MIPYLCLHSLIAMRKKHTSIPVNDFGGEYHSGISIEKMCLNDLPAGTAQHAERHDRHSFHLLEKGIITIEVDFQTHQMTAPAVIYMHPNQVHRILSFENVSVNSWAIDNENLHPEYLKILEELSPLRPLPLNEETFSLLKDAASLCLKLSVRKNDRLYHSLLKDSCNTLVSMTISQYLEQTKPADKLSRFETIAKAFREILEQNFSKLKGPAEYAEKLNISAPYLNECIKNATGHPVSYHIQQRIILEAKRLLYHSGISVKEIATQLGYDDYPYFSRLFTKIAGMSAMAFRKRNPE